MRIGDRVRHKKTGKTGKITGRDWGRDWVIATDKRYRGNDGCFSDGYAANTEDLELITVAAPLPALISNNPNDGRADGWSGYP